tara:strand:- start:623 stop:787 length:165 start_codon:yes stop_codon:yes gene_type:complete
MNMPYDFNEHFKATVLEITNTQRLMVKEQELLNEQQQAHQASEDNEDETPELRF